MSLSSVSENCSICLDALNSQIKTIDLHPDAHKVSHVFHVACIAESLKTNQTCPLCRERISSDQITVIQNQTVAEVARPILQDPAIRERRPPISVFYDAVRGGKHGVVSRFLVKHDLTRSERGFAMRIACLNGKYDIATMIMNSGPVEQEDTNYMYDRLLQGSDPLLISAASGHCFYI